VKNLLITNYFFNGKLASCKTDLSNHPYFTVYNKMTHQCYFLQLCTDICPVRESRTTQMRLPGGVSASVCTECSGTGRQRHKKEMESSRDDSRHFKGPTIFGRREQKKQNKNSFHASEVKKTCIQTLEKSYLFSVDANSFNLQTLKSILQTRGVTFYRPHSLRHSAQFIVEKKNM